MNVMAPTVVEEVDYTIVGAGWFGLSVARTILALSPDVTLVLLDNAASVGGTWAAERLYPWLKTNNIVGTYEHPDFPMDEATYGVKQGTFIPGAVVHQYLEDFARHFGLFDRIRFNTKVLSAERLGAEGWLLKAESVENSPGFRGTIKTKKLVIAAGNTSDPFLPAIEGKEDFGNPIFHMKDLHKRDDVIATSKEVVIVGSGKSAWDGAYAFAKSGVKVHMIIRETGRGPVWMTPAFVTPLKLLLESLVTVRLLTWFNPCIFVYNRGYNFIRTFFAKTFIGRQIVKTFFSILMYEIKRLNKYDSHPTTKLFKPWTHPLFCGVSVSILNHDSDFYALVRGGMVNAHIADIQRAGKGTVSLTNGERLKADAIVFATGWKHKESLDLTATGVASSDLEIRNIATSSNFANRHREFEADEEVFARFPILKDQPIPDSQTRSFREVPVGLTPETRPMHNTQQLYKFIIPPSLLEDRTLAFAGKPLTFITVFFCAVQSLWIASYLKGDLELPPLEKAKEEALLWSRFQIWRNSSGHGTTIPELVFESVPYMDTLLGEMGLKFKRKSNFFWEWFSPYTIPDYKNLVEEYKVKHA